MGGWQTEGRAEPRIEINIALRCHPRILHIHPIANVSVQRESASRTRSSFPCPSTYEPTVVHLPIPQRHDSTPKDSGLGDSRKTGGLGQGVAKGKLGFISRGWKREIGREGGREWATFQRNEERKRERETYIKGGG